MRGNSPIMWHYPVTKCHMRSCDKLKTKNIFFCNADGHQTWQSGKVWWGKPTHNVRWSSDHAIMWSHVTNSKLNISPTQRSMITKHGMLGPDGQRNPPIESPDSLTMWSCVVTWKTKSKTYPLWHDLWPSNLASWWFIVRQTHPWSYIFLMK